MEISFRKARQWLTFIRTRHYRESKLIADALLRASLDQSTWRGSAGTEHLVKCGEGWQSEREGKQQKDETDPL